MFNLNFASETLHLAYICSNSSLNLMFEVFSNKMTFILQVLCSQHDIIFITHGGEGAHCVQVKGWRSCTASDEQA